MSEKAMCPKCKGSIHLVASIRKHGPYLDDAKPERDSTLICADCDYVGDIVTVWQFFPTKGEGLTKLERVIEMLQQLNADELADVYEHLEVWATRGW